MDSNIWLIPNFFGFIHLITRIENFNYKTKWFQFGAAYANICRIVNIFAQDDDFVGFPARSWKTNKRQEIFLKNILFLMGIWAMGKSGKFRDPHKKF